MIYMLGMIQGMETTNIIYRMREKEMKKWKLCVYNVITCSINSVFCNGLKRHINSRFLPDVRIVDRTSIDDQIQLYETTNEING